MWSKLSMRSHRKKFPFWLKLCCTDPRLIFTPLWKRSCRIGLWSEWTSAPSPSIPIASVPRYVHSWQQGDGKKHTLAFHYSSLCLPFYAYVEALFCPSVEAKLPQSHVTQLNKCKNGKIMLYHMLVPFFFCFQSFIKGIFYGFDDPDEVWSRVQAKSQKCTFLENEFRKQKYR